MSIPFLMEPVILLVLVWSVVYVLITQWAKGGKCTSKVRLEGKTVVITGGNAGIGKETALDLAKRGAELHLLCRNKEKAEEVAKEIECATGGKVFSHRLDLSSLESVRECAEELNGKLKKIDILINNAGLMACPLTKTNDGFELQFATNHLGHFLLTLELLPLIRKGEKPRVVTVSSMAHKFGKIHFEDINFSHIPYRPFKSYNQSKLANLLFTKELARLETELGTGVTANCLHPGVVRTELSRYKNESIAARIFHIVFNVILAPFIKDPKSGAQTTIFCAVDESLEEVTGQYFVDCKEASVSEGGKSMEDAKRLWNESLKMVNKNM